MTDDLKPPQETPLESWKSIAIYLNRDARTVMRWEQSEGLPVHRHRHLARSTVYAYPAELDAWRAKRKSEGRPELDRPIPLKRRTLAFAAMVSLAVSSAGGGRVTGLAVARDQPHVVTSGGQELRLVCDNCGDRRAAISADGRWMARSIPVAADNYTAQDLEIRDLRTGEKRPLGLVTSAASPMNAASPIFSPTSDNIAFGFLKGHAGTELRITGIHPGDLVHTLRTFPPFHVVQPVAWTASGHIVIRLHLPDATNTFALVRVADGAVSTLKSLENRIPAAEEHRVSLSPDGRFLAFAALANATVARDSQSRAASRDWQIHTLELTTGQEMAITTGEGAKRDPFWSPDGKTLFYASDLSGAWDLWCVSVRDGQPQGQPGILLNDTGRLTPLGVTAAGTTYLSYDRGGTARTTITTIERPASGERQYETLVGDHPAWSPDGKLIALARPRLDALSGSDVVIRDVTSGREDRLSLSRTGGRVRWFPNGRHLLLLMSDPDQLKTPSQSWYRVDRTSLSTERVASYRTERNAWGLAGSASLDPAGRLLYLAGYVYPSQSLDRVFVVDLSVNRHRQIFQRPQRDSERPAAGSEQVALAVSPDNRQLAMSYIDFASATIRVATLGIDGQGFIEIARAPRPATLAKQLSWSQDGKWIYFSIRPGDNSTSRHRIVKVSRDGGPVQDLGLEVDGLTGFDISSDGSHIAYSTASSEPASRVVLALDLNVLISGRQ